MAEISAEQVKQLRERTGAGMMDCKRALEATGGDMAKAVDWLREKGLASAGKKAGRHAGEGLIEAYIHTNGRVGVLLELNCETDFVARTEGFRQLAHDLALHIAAASPRWVSREQVPPEVVEHEREVIRRLTLEEGKPANIVDKIVEGRLEKQFYAESCLLDQPFVKEPERTVGDLVKSAIAQFGENIVVRRFVRFQLGEEPAGGAAGGEQTQPLAP
ncbi:MAG: translation elongation factor Ts [Bacillota bacterium]|nr:translation elongation factor Ts [Bacillota bacterium]MDI3316517.1 translation elongation factor Ts [Bacillota bacterium]